jgi:cardiolipin synthase A/B
VRHGRGRERRRRATAVTRVAIAIGAAGAITATGGALAGADAHRPTATPATAPEYRLVQYPQAGLGGLAGQIARARRTIDMEMYELADPAIEHDLAAAAGRGVRVRVLLDRAFHGGEVNAAAMSYLEARGVAVRWAPSGVIFHIKATSFDGSTSDISTANLVARYVATSRDAEIIDRDPPQVRAIEATFAHDWAAGPAGDPGRQTVQAPGLVWSPNTGAGTAEAALVGEIAAARRTLDFTSEELSDPAVIGALAAAGRRGVACRIVMTSSAEWDAAFATVRRAGCRIHVFPDSAHALYIHEKLILDDAGTGGESMLLGSQNASELSLTRNRELGIRLGPADGGAAAIAAAGRTFDGDFAQAAPWTPPGASPTPTPTPTRGGCHPRTSTGHCYEPGEYCSDADHGMTGVAGDGETIVCEDVNGWRWEPVS